MSDQPAYEPADLPEETAVEIAVGRDGTNDPSAVGVVIGRWEWKSMQKRKTAEWSIDGVEVKVVQGVDDQALMTTGPVRDPDLLELRLTDEQVTTLRDSGVARFDASGTFPFPVTVVRRD